MSALQCICLVELIAMALSSAQKTEAVICGHNEQELSFLASTCLQDFENCLEGKQIIPNQENFGLPPNSNDSQIFSTTKGTVSWYCAYE